MKFSNGRNVESLNNHNLSISKKSVKNKNVSLHKTHDRTGTIRIPLSTRQVYLRSVYSRRVAKSGSIKRERISGWASRANKKMVVRFSGRTKRSIHCRQQHPGIVARSSLWPYSVDTSGEMAERGLSMTNYGSFHACNVPAHARAATRRVGSTGTVRRGWIFTVRDKDGLKVPRTVVARIMPFGIRPVKVWTTQHRKRKNWKDEGKSRVQSRGLFSLRVNRNDFLNVQLGNRYVLRFALGMKQGDGKRYT